MVEGTAEAVESTAELAEIVDALDEDFEIDCAGKDKGSIYCPEAQ